MEYGTITLTNGKQYSGYFYPEVILGDLNWVNIYKDSSGSEVMAIINKTYAISIEPAPF